MECRICQSVCGEPIYRSQSPSITSMATPIDVDTECYFCSSCGHLQSPDLFDLKTYYDSGYRISLDVSDHDQLYDFKDGEPVYRTDHQAGLVDATIGLSDGARVLDYGAAKAETLKKLTHKHPRIDPHAFDVSEDYKSHWAEWLPKSRQACYGLPDEWNGTFDLVTAHFVLEHVGEPLSMLQDIARLLKSTGKVFLSVPNFLGNPGDFLVVDHVNRFTPQSLREVFRRAGMQIDEIHNNLFRGAFVVVGSNAMSDEASPETVESGASVIELAEFWGQARRKLVAAADANSEKPSVIYGAGFYGAFVASQLINKINLVGFVDRNPHAQSQKFFGLPVFEPEALPEDVEMVYAGLNPTVAPDIIRQWLEQIDRSGLGVTLLD